MNIFYDCEFLEDSKTIDLISIGMVAEDGREFYAVSNEFNVEEVYKDDWLMENVMSSIEHETFDVEDGFANCLCTYMVITDPAAMSRTEIRDGILEFFGDDTHVELWAWYGAYDHVALAQLFGKMINLPEGVPMYTNDIKTFAKLKGNPKLPEQPEGKHNALEDARHNKVRFDFLTELPYKRYTG